MLIRRLGGRITFVFHFVDCRLLEDGCIARKGSEWAYKVTGLELG
jgi:hypothetical protein